MQVPILGIPAFEVGVPSPLCSNRMMKLAANLRIISGAQLLTGKILKSKGLVAGLSFGRMHLAPLDGFASGLWMSRLDVTG